MKLTKADLARGLKSSINAIFMFSGIGGVGYGAWQIYEPSAFIVVGLALIWIGLPER